MSTDTPDFNAAIAACLGRAGDQEVIRLVGKVLDGSQRYDRTGINAIQGEISRALGKDQDRIDLVYGGATKIKGYVFESARLPEIRGASALLDFAGIDEVRRICARAGGYVIYAGGGSFLALAPAAAGAQLADTIERRFTELTQTALSVVVSQTFRLLELRYGRLRFGPDGLISFWLEEFLEDWRQEDLQLALAQYYYEPAEEQDTAGARFYQRKSFGELVTVLATRYNRRRDERATHGEERFLPMVERPPWAARCASSDHRPAVVATDNYGLLSEASARKLAVGRYVKRSDLESVHRLLDAINWDLPEEMKCLPPPDSDREPWPWEERWVKYLRGAGAESSYAVNWRRLGERAEPAADTHQIGAAGNGFIGLIYADGNNVGRKLATLKTPGEYQGFSRQLERAARDAVFAALAEHLVPADVPNEQGQRTWCHPFEILTVGGDDLLLIVPGDRALEIALSIGYAFERAMRAEGRRERVGRYSGPYDHGPDFDAYRPEIGLSAGLAIAHADAPIFFLRELVEQLLKSAKERSRSSPQEGGAIDFMVLKSITMVTDTIKSFRAAALEGSKCRLTARPYLWPELAGLLATLTALKSAGVPRSQLYRLREVLLEALDQGPMASSLEYLYTRTRQGGEVARALQAYVEQHWQPRGVPVGVPPWLRVAGPKPNQPEWETIWADLVELYDVTLEPRRQEETHA